MAARSPGAWIRGIVIGVAAVAPSSCSRPQEVSGPAPSAPATPEDAAADPPARPSPNAPPPAPTAVTDPAVPGGPVKFTVIDAIVAGDLLVALESGGVVVARRLDGAEVWRTTVGTAPPGGELLQRLPGAPRVLVRRQGSLVALDLRDGGIAARHAVELADRLFMWQRDGACGLRGKCSMQLLDCATGRPLGAPIEGMTRHMRDPDGGYDSGCWGFEVDLVGRVGDTVVYLTRDVGSEGGPTAVGVSARDGAQVWGSKAVACSYCSSEQYGMSPAGTWCFAGHDDEVTVFACQSGKVQWTRPFRGLRHALWAGDERGGVFVDAPGAAALLEPATGKWRWRVSVPAGSVALPRRARLTDVADIAFAVERPTPLLVLDEGSGRVAAEHTMKPGHTLTTGADGSVILADERDDRDHTGQVLPSRSPVPVTIDRTRVPASSSGPPNHAEVRSVDGRTIASLDLDAWALGWTREAGEVRLAVMLASDPRTVVLYRFAEVPAAPTRAERAPHP